MWSLEDNWQKVFLVNIATFCLYFDFAQIFVFRAYSSEEQDQSYFNPKPL